MKFLVKIVIILFLAFQFIPAIVSCMDNEEGEKWSLVLFDEEEEGAEESKDIKEFKEIKTEFLPTQFELHFVYFALEKLQVVDCYCLMSYTAVTSLPLMPPELV